MFKSSPFPGIEILVSRRAYIENKGKFVKLVRKFEKKLFLKREFTNSYKCLFYKEKTTIEGRLHLMAKGRGFELL